MFGISQIKTDLAAVIAKVETFASADIVLIRARVNALESKVVADIAILEDRIKTLEASIATAVKSYTP